MKGDNKILLDTFHILQLTPIYNTEIIYIYFYIRTTRKITFIFMTK